MPKCSAAFSLTAPILSALKVLSIPIVITVFAVEWTFMQEILMTTPLTGGQWLACIGLAVVVPIVVEVSKWIRRSQGQSGAPGQVLDVEQVVDPERARMGAR